MDKFTAMQAFVRVVEAGNFTKAADSMAVPKPTITSTMNAPWTQTMRRLKGESAASARRQWRTTGTAKLTGRSAKWRRPLPRWAPGA